MAWIIGIIVGILVCGFVFIMWGHKNTEKTGEARGWINRQIDKVVGWVKGIFD